MNESYDGDFLIGPTASVKLASTLSSSKASDSEESSFASIASTSTSLSLIGDDDPLKGIPLSFNVIQSSHLQDELDAFDQDPFDDKSNTLKARLDTSQTLLKAPPQDQSAVHFLGNRKVVTQLDEDDGLDLDSIPVEFSRALRTKASFASHLSDDVEEDAKLMSSFPRGVLRSPHRPKSSLSSLSSQAEADDENFEEGIELPIDLHSMSLSSSKQTPKHKASAHSRESSAASVSSLHSKTSGSSASRSPTSMLLKPGSARTNRQGGTAMSTSASSNLSASDGDDFFDDLEMPGFLAQPKATKIDLQAMLTDNLRKRAQLDPFDEPDDAPPSKHLRRAASHREKKSETFEDGLVIEDTSFMAKTTRSGSGNDLHANLLRNRAQQNTGPVTRSRTLLHSRSFTRAMSDAAASGLAPIAGSPVAKETLARRHVTLDSPPRLPPVPVRRPSSRNDSLVPSTTTSAARLLRHKKSTPHLSQATPQESSSHILSRKRSMPSLLHMPSISSLGDISHATITPANIQKHVPSRSSRRYGSLGDTKQDQREGSASPTVPPARPSTPAGSAAAIRLTMPTLSSKAKSRSPSSHNLSNLASDAVQPRSNLRTPSSPVTRGKRKPYGDGTELDAFDDLPVSKEGERRFTTLPKRPHVTRQTSLDQPYTTPKPKVPAKQRFSVDIPVSHRKRKSDSRRVQPQLIRPLGNSTTARVEGRMTYNPKLMKWEGNDGALQAFDTAMATSARPALISPFPVRSPNTNATVAFSHVRKREKDMEWDAQRMCWINVNQEEEELDFGDDEADQIGRDWTSGADTMKLRGKASFASDMLGGSTSEDDFLQACKVAETRHRHEMRYWPVLSPEQLNNRDYLWSIRRIVTDQ